MNERGLTPEEWAQARRRWEGSTADGFDWLAAEIRAAWAVDITRQGVSVRAARYKWTKGGDPSAPLAMRPGPTALPSTAPVAPLKPALAPRESKRNKDTPPRSVAQQTPAESITDIGADGRPVPPKDQGQDSQGADDTADKPWIPKPAPLGRPTKYRPEFAEELVKYFSSEPFETLVLDAESSRTTQVPGKFPMFEAFAAKIGVTSETVRAWATETDESGNRTRPEFAAAFARARDLQHCNLVQGTMVGAYEPRFAGLAAKNMIGWREKLDIAADAMVTSRAFLEATYVTEMALAHERQALVRAERRALRGVDE